MQNDRSQRFLVPLILFVALLPILASLVFAATLTHASLADWIRTAIIAIIASVVARLILPAGKSGKNTA